MNISLRVVQRLRKINKLVTGLKKYAFFIVGKLSNLFLLTGPTRDFSYGIRTDIFLID